MPVRFRLREYLKIQIFSAVRSGDQFSDSHGKQYVVVWCNDVSTQWFHSSTVQFLHVRIQPNLK